MTPFLGRVALFFGVVIVAVVIWLGSYVIESIVQDLPARSSPRSRDWLRSRQPSSSVPVQAALALILLMRILLVVIVAVTLVGILKSG